MPSKTKKTHHDIRKLICGICFKKKKHLQNITLALLALITTFIYSFYDLNDLSLPTVLCFQCRIYLINGDLSKIASFDYRTIPAYHETRSKDTDCECFLCRQWKINACTPMNTVKRTPLPEHICPTCHQSLKRGMNHQCSQEEFFRSALNLIYSKGDKLAEQVATKVLLKKASDDGTTDMILSNRGGGRGLKVHLGETPHLPQYSHENAMKLRNQLNCSDRQFNKIMKANRVVYGRKSVQPGLREVVEESNSMFTTYFDSKKVTVENFTIDPSTKIKKTFYEEKPMIYCNNTDAFIHDLFHQRSVLTDSSIIRLGMDGGQDFLKISLNIVNEDEISLPPKRSRYSEGVAPLLQKSTSVKKSFILSIMPDIKELYFNMALILSHLKCDLLHFPSKLVKITADLKVVNKILGIQGHSCIHSCPFCVDSSPFLDSDAERRTLGGLRREYSHFESAGCPLGKAKYFYNVVHPPLIEGEDNVFIKDIFVPPELHIFTGIVNHIIDFLITLTPSDLIINYFKSKNIVRASYHGGKFEGNQCSKIMNKLDEMELMLQTSQNFITIVNCIPIIDLLRKFKVVKSSCFSYDLSLNYKDVIRSFEESYRSLNISVTPKAHILFVHVPEFCEKWG